MSLLVGVKPRHAQERHTHSGLVGGAGEGWSGVVTAVHSSSSGTLSSIGLTPTAAGSSSSVDKTVVLTGTAMQARPRFVRKHSGNYGGWYCPPSNHYLNTMRGFHCRWTFGTVNTYVSASPFFVGLFLTPTFAFSSFTGWATTYAMGMYKQAASDAIDFAWRVDGSTTGSVSTGMSWIHGAVYQLELDCEPLAVGGVRARLSSSEGEAFEYVMSTFPDSNVDSDVVLGPAALVGSGSSSTQFASCSFDSVEPW